MLNKLVRPNGKENRIDILDHGYVRLVEHMGSDMSIVRSARVSYDAEPRNDGSDEKLLRYLYKNRHTSPFEAVEFQFEVKCPMFIGRQWHRHRTWAYNEVSARYTALPEEFYVPDESLIGSQNKRNKQQRDVGQMSEDGSFEYITCKIMQEHGEQAFEDYKGMIKEGVPRELARTILPVSTYTRFFAKADLHNLLHFLRLRLHPHAQIEIQAYAQGLLDLITPIVPLTANIFLEGMAEQQRNEKILAIVADHLNDDEMSDDDAQGYLWDALRAV